MWQFIETYLARARAPLTAAGLTATWALVVVSLLPSFAIIFAYMIGAYALIYSLIPLILNRFNLHYDGRLHRTQLATHGLTIFLLFVSAPYIFPHYFLLFSALPLALPNTAFVLTAFLAVYETVIHAGANAQLLGDDFSLVKMIVNPRVQLARLYRKIMPRPPAHLELTVTETNQLVDRQNRALNQLPDQAFILRHTIDDLAVLEENVRGPAIEGINQTYLATLTLAQQTCYRRYRDLTIKLSPNLAECPISYETVTLATQNEFILIEKRTIGTAFEPAKAVPAISRIFQRLSFNTARASQAANPRLPGTEDSINTPTAWNDQDTEYKYHTYALVQGHALSLELCEAIEAFNVSLRLAPGASSGVPRRRDAPMPPPPAAVQRQAGVAPIIVNGYANAIPVPTAEVLVEAPRQGFLNGLRTRLSSSPGTNAYALNPPVARFVGGSSESVVVAEPVHDDLERMEQDMEQELTRLQQMSRQMFNR